MKDKILNHSMNKNLFKPFIFTLALCFVLLFVSTDNILASEAPTHRTTVNIKANVPSDFSEEIVFAIQDENTGLLAYAMLTHDNGYSDSMSLLGNTEYETALSFPSRELYFDDLGDTYTFDGNLYETDLIINITYMYADTINQIQSDVTADVENVTTQCEQIDEVTGLYTPEYVLSKYYESLSAVIGNPYYSDFFSTYSGKMFNKYYLKADSLNTQEQWDSMNEYERFTYYICYYSPTFDLIRTDYSNVDSYLQGLRGVKSTLSTVEGGMDYYNAICEVWEWHYWYWLTTGTTYNFFDYYTGEPIKSEMQNDDIEETETPIVENTIVENITVESMESETIVSSENTNSPTDTVTIVTSNEIAKEAAPVKESSPNSITKIVAVMLFLILAVFIFSFYKNKHKH